MAKPHFHMQPGTDTGLLYKLFSGNSTSIESTGSGDGQTQFAFAAAYSHKGVVKVILDAGKVNADWKNGYDERTPLSLAAEHGHCRSLVV
jgi:hypothetical protein